MRLVPGPMTFDLNATVLNSNSLSISWILSPKTCQAQQSSPPHHRAKSYKMTSPIVNDLAELKKKLSRNANFQEIQTAAKLAESGVLPVYSLDTLRLENINVDRICTERLKSLASCVNRRLEIVNVDGDANLKQMLENLNIEELYVEKCVWDLYMCEALVFPSRVETITFGKEMILDINTFTEYDGLGKCRMVKCLGDTATRYKEDLLDWALGINWEMYLENGYIRVKRQDLCHCPNYCLAGCI